MLFDDIVPADSYTTVFVSQGIIQFESRFSTVPTRSVHAAITQTCLNLT